MAKQVDYPPPLPQDELRYLIATAQSGKGKRASEARSKACLHNMRLVCGIAKGFVSRGLSLEDLIQDGCLVLARCVDKFDLTRECNGRPIQFSTYATWAITNDFRRMLKTVSSKATERTTDQDDGDWHPRWDINEYDQPADVVDAHRGSLRIVMQAVLDERERKVLDMRVSGVTLDDIGTKLAVSKERVRQVQQRALEKLAEAFGHHGKVGKLKRA